MQAVLLAGDRGASKAVRGKSKAFIEVGGRPMVVHVLEALLHTPEVSEVFVVGDPIRLEKALAEHGCLQLAAARSRPVHVVPQKDTLYDNVWCAFLRTLPPGAPDPDHSILVVPADIPLVIPEEISGFLADARKIDADYVLGLTPEHALRPYAPSDGSPGIEMACFNLAEGRFRQNNLHWVKPLRLGHRHYIQDVYENRYQKQFGSGIRLALRILRREYRHLWVLFYYLLIHLAGILDRRGHRRAADRVRARVPLARVERGIGAMLAADFRTSQTQLGGAALDIDNDQDLAAAEKMADRWKTRQVRLAHSLPRSA